MLASTSYGSCIMVFLPTKMISPSFVQATGDRYFNRMSPSRSYFLFIILFSTLLLPSTTLSATIQGKVIKVADGDTITILNNHNQQTKIRLYGIDTPEKSQAYGKKAKKFTASLTAGKTVKVKVYDTDRYGRSVGVVFVGGTNVNEEIIRNGYAWQYRKYCKLSFCSDWLRIEKQARDRGIGLWADNNPVAPWEYRRAKRNGSSSKSSNVIGGSGIYHGNAKSHVFHDSGCRYYNCKNCTVVFKSANDAVRAGYRAHKQCVKQ
jgi:endonuclease YncB( thermonuclease family)